MPSNFQARKFTAKGCKIAIYAFFEEMKLDFVTELGEKCINGAYISKGNDSGDCTVGRSRSYL